MIKHRYLLFFLLVLGACSLLEPDEEDAPLTGERISVLQLERALKPDQDVAETPIVLPPIWRNEFWPQAGGYPNHAMHHLALNEGVLTQKWEARIGTGMDDGARLSSTPIVVDDIIYSMDVEGRVKALNLANGKLIWEYGAHPEDEDAVTGGGLSYSSGLLIITTGYAEIYALDAKTGVVRWHKKMNAPARAAASVLDGRVFAQSSDNGLNVYDLQTGDSLWSYQGVAEVTTLLGGAAPAVNRDVVVAAFSNGDVVALRVGNGAVAWRENLSKIRRVGALSDLSDIKGMPVIDKGVVYITSYNGRLVAIDLRTGNRLWETQAGGLQTPWIAGDVVYVLNKENELAAIHRNNGSAFWVKGLPRFEDEEDKEDPILWAGPVLANDSLYMTGSRGELLLIDPLTGNITKNIEINGGATTLPPIVAGGVLYTLSDNGRLTAYNAAQIAVPAK